MHQLTLITSMYLQLASCHSCNFKLHAFLILRVILQTTTNSWGKHKAQFPRAMAFKWPIGHDICHGFQCLARFAFDQLHPVHSYLLVNWPGPNSSVIYITFIVYYSLTFFIYHLRLIINSLFNQFFSWLLTGCFVHCKLTSSSSPRYACSVLL